MDNNTEKKRNYKTRKKIKNNNSEINFAKNFNAMTLDQLVQEYKKALKTVQEIKNIFNTVNQDLKLLPESNLVEDIFKPKEDSGVVLKYPSTKNSLPLTYFQTDLKVKVDGKEQLKTNIFFEDVKQSLKIEDSSLLNNSNLNSTVTLKNELFDSPNVIPISIDEDAMGEETSPISAVRNEEIINEFSESSSLLTTKMVGETFVQKLSSEKASLNPLQIVDSDRDAMLEATSNISAVRKDFDLPSFEE